MEHDGALTFTPVEHPDGRVQRAGFDLTDPYVEQCWGPVVDPSATLLLRRLPTLWTERVPATITHRELGRSLGLGAGRGDHNRLTHALDRTVRFGLAKWDEQGRALDVYLRLPALTDRQLHRLPEWTQRTHERLLDTHVRQLNDHEANAPRVAAITARFDRLQRPCHVEPASPLAPDPALEP